jgi:hypothetical protein
MVNVSMTRIKCARAKHEERLTSDLDALYFADFPCVQNRLQFIAIQVATTTTYVTVDLICCKLNLPINVDTHDKSTTHCLVHTSKLA